MKVWVFYKKPSKDLKNIPIESIGYNRKYPIYAITDNKKFAKIFRNSRNMDKFLEKQWDISKDEVDEWRITHRGSELSMVPLESFKNKNTDNQSVCYVEILATEDEINYTLEICDTGQIFNKIEHWVDPSIFTKKIRNALEILKYRMAMKFFYGFTTSLPFEDDLGGPVDVIDLDVSFDQLSIFLLIYNDMISPSFMEYIHVYDEVDYVNRSKYHNQTPY